MADIQQVIAAGVQLAQYHFLDSNGYIAGTTGTAAAGASGSAMGVILGIQSADVTVPEPDRVPIPGDDTTLGIFQFDSTETPSFTIDVGVHDLGIDAYAQGTNVVNDGDMTFGVLQPSQPTYRDALLILSSVSKSYESDSRGVSKWYHYVIPKVTMQPLGRVTIQGREGAAFRYACIANVSTTRGAGATMRTGTGFEGTESATILPFTSDNRITMQRYVGDNSTTVWNLAKIPASSAIAKTRVYVNGVIRLSGVTISVAAKTLTITPAVATDLPIVVIHEYVNS